MDIALPAIAQHVLHKYFGPEMRKRKSAPLHVSLNELMPAVMSDPGVIVPARPEVDDMCHPRPFRRIEEVLALAHHVDGIAGDQKRPIDTLQRWFNRLDLIKIEVYDGDTEVTGLLGIANGRDHFHVRVIL